MCPCVRAFRSMCVAVPACACVKSGLCELQDAVAFRLLTPCPAFRWQVKCSCKNPKTSSQPPTPRLADCSPPVEERMAPLGGGAEALAPAGTSASANGAGSGSNSGGSKLHTGRGVSLSSNLSASARSFLTGKPSPAALQAPAAASSTSSEGLGAQSAVTNPSVGVDDTSVSNPKVSHSGAATTELEAAGAHGETAVAGAQGQSTAAVSAESQDPSV